MRAELRLRLRWPTRSLRLRQSARPRPPQRRRSNASGRCGMFATFAARTAGRLRLSLMSRIAALAARPAASAFGEKRSLCSTSAARAKISLVRASPESGNAIGVDASIPMARARCCVTIRSGAFGPHSSTNSCSRRSSRPSTGKANNTSPGALTRIGLRACSSPKARLTLRCSSSPNRAEFAGECAAFICRTFFYWARSWNTESPESFRQKSDGFLGSTGR